MSLSLLQEARKNKEVIINNEVLLKRETDCFILKFFDCLI